MAIEGLVIVVSILLAFTIDAWWDERRDAEDEEAQVARVLAELRSNAALLDAQMEALDSATQAASEFLGMMGPDAEDVPVSAVGDMLYRIYGVNTISLGDSASRNFVSTGQLTDDRWTDLRLALADLLSSIHQVERASLELRQMRPEMLRQMWRHVSGLDVVKAAPPMADYPESKFQSNVGALLSDIAFEGMVASYAIRMELNRGSIQRLEQQLGDVIARIEATP
jgi:hypothetical protein